MAIPLSSHSQAPRLNPQLLEFVCCPVCRGEVVVDGAEQLITDGKLKCTKCSALYPVRHGVPVLIANVSGDERFTAKNFGEQWDYFDKLGGLGTLFEEGEFEQYFHPIDLKMLAGKTILEGGCGYGRNLLQCRKAGAAVAIGFDISPAAFIAKRNGVDTVIGDILNPPFRQQFDIVFTFGVLQHVSSPETALQTLNQLVKEGGIFAHSVYSYENNQFLAKYLTPVRKKMLRYLPLGLRKFIAHVLAVPSYIFFSLFYRPFSLTKRTAAWASENLFYFDFITMRIPGGYKGWAAQVFDQINAPLAEYFPKAWVETEMAKLPLTATYTYFRNKNTWNFGGRKSEQLFPQRANVA